MTALKLPIPLNMEPMLSAPGDGIPKGDSWEYEPKWDGFRTLVFRDGDNVELVSRGARPMTRYFPELLPAFRKLRQDRVVLDGELIVVGANGLDFGALQQRIHPADSRVRMLSEATPAWYVAFDILAEGGDDLRSEALGKRRKRLESLLKGVKQPIFLTPYTRDPATAEDWFKRLGRRARWCDGEILDRRLRAGEEALGEGQAPAHRRLRGHRLAQVKRRQVAWLAAAG